MTQEEFITRLIEDVKNVAVSGFLDGLKKPAGKRPSDDLMRQSKFFNGLSAGEKGVVQEIVDGAASLCLFRLLCIIDGVASLQGKEAYDHLEFRFIVGESERPIERDKDGWDMHDMFVDLDRKARRN
ncbi:MAG: hypothetical protein U1E49_19750 [Hyphomicrobiaceae bacterium]